MIKGLPKLYKVTLRLFTYHLQTGNLNHSDRFHVSRSDIQAYYEILLRDYHASDSQGAALQIQWRSDEPQRLPFDLLDIPATNGRQVQKFILAWHPPFKGFFYSQLFDDSYIGSFTFYLPDLSGKDGLILEELQGLKPSIHFFTGTTVGAKDNPEQQQLCQTLRTAFLGKTLILSTHLTEDPEDLTEFAQSCLLSFLGLSSVQAAPPLRHRWRCFNGYMYEFCTGETDDYYGKIWLFLTFRQASITRLDKAQLDLAELFFYDHKNCQNHQESQVEYHQGVENIQKVEKIIQNFPSSISDDQIIDLSPELLKENLRMLLDISLSYSQNLRSLSDFHNTIDRYRDNYEQKIIYIETITDSNLTSMLKLADRTFGKYQKQITVNLTDLAEGARLLDTAIATIRGLVEIEQAEGDRILQQQNRDLQDHIQAIGMGIGAGAIAASSSTLIFKPQGMTFPLLSKHPGAYPHPFIIAVFLSFGFAIGFWALGKWVLPQILPKNQPSSRGDQKTRW